MSDLNLRVSLTALDNATGPMRRAMAAAQGLAGGMAKVQRELDAARRSLKDSVGYRQLSNDLKDLKTEWAAARQKVRELAAAQAQEGAVTKAAARDG